MSAQIDRQKEIPGLTKPVDFFPDGRTHAAKGLYGMYRAGRVLTFTLETGVAKMISVFKRSTTPYVDGSLPSRHHENVKRVGSFLFGAGLTVIGAAPAILGLICVSFSNIFRKDFTVIAPKQPSPLASELPKSIQEKGFRIASFNVAGLPPIIQPLNHMRPFEERCDELIEYLLSLDCDCVCLQELFDENAIHAIMTCKPLREKFPYMILGAGRQTFGVNSGLATLSLYPIEEPEFRAYTELNDEDIYAKKGILANRIRVSEKDEFVVFNTHTQSGHQPRDVQARKVAFEGFEQFEEAYTPPAQKMRTDANGKQVKLHASFAVGDFNTCPYFADGTRNAEWDSPELVKFFKTRHARIPCDGRAIDPNKPQEKEAMLATHWLRNTPYTGWDISKVALWQKERKELDHMLISLVHAHDIELAEVHADESATCSDHIAILGTFKPKFRGEV